MREIEMRAKDNVGARQKRGREREMGKHFTAVDGLGELVGREGRGLNFSIRQHWCLANS